MPPKPSGIRLHHALAPTLTAAILAAGGCSTNNGTDKPDDDTTPTSQPSVGFEPSDQSAKLLEARLPQAQGSVKGEVDGTPATLTVAEVRVIPSGTQLTFWYAGPSKPLVRNGESDWEKMPRLVDLSGKQIYDPVIYKKPDGRVNCVCTDGAYIREQPQPRTVLYPKLPDNITDIQVRKEGFNTAITIPVTSE